jgi:hypothetical protein
MMTELKIRGLGPEWPGTAMEKIIFSEEQIYEIPHYAIFSML